ncbi:MAG: ABC transporter ATP-binding protein [Candidatus Rokuibacteriota bacterium]
MALLELEGVCRAFGGVRAVSDVSFTVDEGELVGVMGPNGSGKTTLFNLITGALRPDAGRVRLAGRDITGWPPYRICAEGIARTFQHVRPFGGLTALDNVLVGRLYGRARERRATAAPGAEKLLALVGLGGRGHLPAVSLTLMDRKRLELARALATEPHLLLLDEFMAGLNPAETESVMALLRRLQQEGVTILMVEHIVWALLDLSRRVVVLSAGEKIAEGPPDAVAADPTVVDVYLGTGAGSRRRA